MLNGCGWWKMMLRLSITLLQELRVVTVNRVLSHQTNIKIHRAVWKSCDFFTEMKYSWRWKAPHQPWLTGHRCMVHDAVQTCACIPSSNRRCFGHEAMDGRKEREGGRVGVNRTAGGRTRPQPCSQVDPLPYVCITDRHSSTVSKTICVVFESLTLRSPTFLLRHSCEWQCSSLLASKNIRLRWAVTLAALMRTGRMESGVSECACVSGACYVPSLRFIST